MALVPNRLKRRECRMQAEEAVQIEHRASRDVDGRAHRVIGLLAVRNDNIEAVGCAALENNHESLVPITGFERAVSSACEECRDGGSTRDRERTISQEYPPGDSHVALQFSA